MPTLQRIPSRLEGPGPRLPLDFANTLRRRLTDRPLERLGSYADLVGWSQEAGLLTAAEARRLLGRAMRSPREAAAALRRAIRLREATYRTFSAVAAGRVPEEADLGALNQALTTAMAQARVVRSGKGFAWETAGDEEALDRPLWAVARAAAEFLTAGDLGAVRKCAEERCAWLFLDESRNRSRRWCDMRVCGNRAKARRHYERQRSTSRPRAGALRS